MGVWINIKMPADCSECNYICGLSKVKYGRNVECPLIETPNIDYEKLFPKPYWMYDEDREATREEILDKASRKLAQVHAQIDLYGDRPDLHDDEYWREYLLDPKWVDYDIDWKGEQK